MPLIIRVILKIFVLYILFNSLNGCKEKECFYNIRAELSGNELKIFRNNQILLQEQSGDLFTSTYFKNKPYYIIDSANCKIYINLFNQKLISYNLITNRLSDSITLENMKYNFDFRFKIANGFIIVKSNKNLLVFDKELKLKQNIMDSIFKTDFGLKFKVQGFWDYQIINDSIFVKLKALKDGSIAELEEKVYAFPLH